MSVLIVIVILFTQRTVKPNVSFPVCQASEPNVTYLSFYVDDKVKWRSELKGKLSAAVKLSNEILMNSCIDMTRKVAEIRYIPITNSSRSTSDLHTELQRIVGNSEISALHKSSVHQYVLVLNSNHVFLNDEDIYGTTMMNVNDSFVVLDEEFPLHVLEHELGHLAWAMHERTDTKHADFWVNEQVFPNNRDKVKLCGWLFLLGFWNRDDLF